MSLLLAVLLQITYMPPDPLREFKANVRSAAYHLQVPPIEVEVSTQQRMAAWVQHGPAARWRIFVNPNFLREADPLARRSVAFHESCHLYTGNNRRHFFPGEEDLVHKMVAGCVEWLWGPEFHRAMTTMPCQKWYPLEAKLYNRRIGKERCIAKR